MTRTIAVWLTLATCAAIAVGGFYLGIRVNESGWQKKAARWLAEITKLEAARAKDADRHRTQAGKLQADIADLKARLKVQVQPDAECQSLPTEWRDAWNAR